MDPVSSPALEVREIAALATRSVKPEMIDTHFDQTKVLAFPDKTIVSLERFQAVPWRQRAKVELFEVRSFIAYVNKFKKAQDAASQAGPETLVFGAATESGGTFGAIIDYHGSSSAAWGEHIVGLALVVTPEWRRWLSCNRKPMPQEEFAEFIEDNLLDIVDPPAADLLEVAQMLTGKKGVTFKSGRNLRDGSIDFQYSEQIEVGAGRRDDQMKVPDHFVIGLCPFVGANGVRVKARLRFRISDSGKLSFFFILDHPEKIVEEAFTAARDQIATETELEVHMGSAKVLPVIIT